MPDSDGEHIKSEIPAYLSGALLESRRRQFEAHVAGCTACRTAVTKARSKLSRARRQALKNAVPEPLPNLLFNRLGRQAASVRPKQHHLWRWVGLILVVGGVAILFSRKESRLARMAEHLSTAAQSEEASSPVSSGTITAPVAESVPTVKAPAAAVAPALPSNAAAANPAAVSSMTVASAPPEPFVPQAWSGPDSGVREFREVIVKGRAGWRALWQEMGQTDPAPRVNFYQALVVGIFVGEKPGLGNQVALGSPREENGGVVIPYKVTEVAVATSSPTAVTHPYALTTIPRTSKPVHFEQAQ